MFADSQMSFVLCFLVKTQGRWNRGRMILAESLCSKHHVVWLWFELVIVSSHRGVVERVFCCPFQYDVDGEIDLRDANAFMIKGETEFLDKVRLGLGFVRL
jgi:hypothetical protein